MGSREKTVRLAVLIGALGLCALGFHRNRLFYHDDAFITLRYAYNFIEGHGIVWNPGERVEGYTSLFFLLLVSGFGRLGVDLVIASRVVNLAAFSLLAIFAAAYLRRLAPAGRIDTDRVLKTVAWALILTTLPMIVWTLGGLEAPLFTLFCTLGIWSFSRAIASGLQSKTLLQSGAAFAVACLVRLDAGLLAALSLVWLIVAVRQKPGSRAKPILGFVLPLLLLVGPSFVWRLVYYGEFLPNTFYVKATDPCFRQMMVGLKYVATYLISPPFLLPLLGAAMIYTAHKRSVDQRAPYLGCAVLGYLAYVVFVGGDQMPAYRFVVPVIPSMILLLYLALRPHVSHLGGWRSGATCVVALGLMALQTISQTLNPRKLDPAAYFGSAIGRYIATAWPEGSLVALNTAGSTPYYAPHHCYIDMLGLNDATIARRRITSRQLPWQWKPGHAKGDGAYVLSRSPDYIILGPATGTTPNHPWFLSDLEIAQAPEFTFDYERVHVSLGQELLTRDAGWQPPPFWHTSLTYYKRRGSSTRWRSSQMPTQPTGITNTDIDDLSRLVTLGYVAGSTRAPDVQNVTIYDSQLACDGINLYTSGHAPEAIAIDMNGNLLHTWRFAIDDIWPDRVGRPDSGFWRRAHWYPNGDVLAIFDGVGLVKLDKDSNLLWAYRGCCHHQAFVTEDGNIYVLTRRALVVQRINPSAPVVEDMIDILDSHGKLLAQYSLLECLMNSRYRQLLRGVRREKGGDVDIFHTNAIKVFDGSLADVSPVFRKNNVLISILYLHAVAVVDLDLQEVVWALSGRRNGAWRRQHDPTLLENGHLLLFDNQGRAGRSKVIEIEPFTGTMVWEYPGDQDSEFYSETCGVGARLPNGNTLITESDKGRAFEVTPDGTIVWEFYNPHRAGQDDELIATLFEMVRVDKDFFAWLDADGDK